MDRLGTFDGIRIDSGDKRKETEKIIARCKEIGVDPSTKSVVYNALTIDKAIELNKWLDGRMRGWYGIETHLCADVSKVGLEVIRKEKQGNALPCPRFFVPLQGK